eukprot:31197-Pelagococcus_subviridis.AAC.17
MSPYWCKPRPAGRELSTIPPNKPPNTKTLLLFRKNSRLPRAGFSETASSARLRASATTSVETRAARKRCWRCRGASTLRPLPPRRNETVDVTHAAAIVEVRG